MDENLQPYVKKLLDGGMKTAEEVAKFIETQTPELGKEVIAWGAVSESVAPLMGLIIICSCIYAHVKCRETEWYNPKKSYEPPVILFNIVAFILGNMVFWSSIMDVFYPIFAPRLYILEKISQLIK
jgi:lysylphosphatidylglycerol synthetase-like protein (DUF2156 family)